MARAAAAGVKVLAVTDHDTVAGCAAAADACASARIEFVRGIEITAVVDGADVHVLGYFVQPGSKALEVFRLNAELRRRTAPALARWLGRPETSARVVGGGRA